MDENRTERIGVCLTPEEARQLRCIVKPQGRSASGFMRMLAVAYVRSPRVRDAVTLAITTT